MGNIKARLRTRCRKRRITGNILCLGQPPNPLVVFAVYEGSMMAGVHPHPSPPPKGEGIFDDWGRGLLMMGQGGLLVMGWGVMGWGGVLRQAQDD